MVLYSRRFAAAIGMALVLVAAAPVHELGRTSVLAQAKARAAKLRQAWMASHPGKMPLLTNPEIISGTVTTPNVDMQTPPAAPGVRFRFKTGPAGLTQANFEFVNQADPEQSVYTYYYSDTGPRSGTITLLRPGVLSQYQPAGTYVLNYVYLYDAAGNFTSYTGSQIQSIFTTDEFSLTNTHSDSTMPSIASGKITTPTVRLSSPHPFGEASLSVSDDLSGVSYAYVEFYNADLQQEFFLSGNAPSPILSGTLPIGENLSEPGGTPPSPGTYTLSELSVQDNAGNFTSVTDPATLQSLFGSLTITVKN